MNKNEEIKKKYMYYLEKYGGKSSRTVDLVVSAIYTFQSYTKNKEFHLVREKDVDEFKDYLRNKVNERTNKNISLSTQFDCLRHLKAFYSWLCREPGYRTKIDPNLSMLFRLTLKEEESLKGETIRSCPPNMEYIDRLIDGIKADSEIDKRDRALISLIAMTGLRDSALSSLPIKALNLENKILIQSYSDKVRVKFGKTIHTKLMVFSDDYLKYLKDWYDYLNNEKGFNGDDPLFPKMNIAQQGQLNFSYTIKEFKPLYMKNASPIRKILRDRCSNAGLAYYPPHSFRHTVVKSAMSKATSYSQMKAISQSIGHSHIETTMMTYAKLPNDMMFDLVDKIDFKSKNNGPFVI